MRPIDADAIIDDIKEVAKRFENENDFISFSICNIMLEYIKGAPTIEAEPVKHGSWVKHRIEKYDNYGNYTNAPGLTVCSNCNFSAYGIAEIYNFCPQCGARMRGDEK